MEQQPFLISGTSGFSYPDWKRGFYPRLGHEIAYYARHFHTVEVNQTFHRLPTPQLLASWAKRTPANFTFAVKAWRGITHEGRLRDLEALEDFLQPLRHLGAKCGPILFQLPKSLTVDEALLADFLAALPRHHRYAFEMRHESWHTDKVHGLLFDAHAALVHVHCKGWTPRTYTAPFAYLRMNGTKGLYRGTYVDVFLKQLLRSLEHHALEQVYVYFNNTKEGLSALQNASALQHYALHARNARYG